jgi:hypothetical protein
MDAVNQGVESTQKVDALNLLLCAFIEVVLDFAQC